MTKNFWMSIFLGISISISAQDKILIDFQNDQTWEQVLDKAANENKVVFVDIFTDWCSPCKRLEKEVFTQESVADVFNERFINYRINAEKGEGIQLAKKYRVTGFPYLIFTDPKGNLIYSVLGYRSEKDILKEADLAFKEMEDPKPLGIWAEEYDINKDNVSWLKGYIEKRNKLRMDNGALLDDYYSMLDSSVYMNTENLILIVKSSGIKLNSNVLKIISKNFDRISLEADSAFNLQGSLIGVFDNAFNKPLLKAIRDTNENIITNELIPWYNLFPESVRSMPWYSKQDANKWKFIYFSQSKNIPKLVQVADKYFEKYYFSLSVEQIRQSDSIIYSKSKIEFKKQGMDLASPMINQYFSTFTTNDHMEKLVDGAYTVYNNTKNPQYLNKALTWTERALSIKESNSNYEIKAKILYALTRKQEAVAILLLAVNNTNDENEKNRLLTIINDIQQNREIK